MLLSIEVESRKRRRKRPYKNNGRRSSRGRSVKELMHIGHLGQDHSGFVLKGGRKRMKEGATTRLSPACREECKAESRGCKIKESKQVWRMTPMGAYFLCDAKAQLTATYITAERCRDIAPRSLRKPSHYKTGQMQDSGWHILYGSEPNGHQVCRNHTDYEYLRISDHCCCRSYAETRSE